jgi:hypothetical protein
MEIFNRVQPTHHSPHIGGMGHEGLLLGDKRQTFAQPPETLSEAAATHAAALANSIAELFHSI